MSTSNPSVPTLKSPRAHITMRAFVSRLICLCILPPLALAAWLGYESVQFQRAEYHDDARHLTHNFAVSIDQRLDARISGLRMLALSALVDDPRRWPDLYQEAKEYQESFGAHVIFARAEAPMQMLFNTRAPYGSPLPGLPAVGDIVIGPVAGKPLVAVAVPVMRQGRAAYIMLTTIDTKRIQQRLDQLALPEE